MPDGERDQEPALWVEKITWRLSECEADILAHSGDGDRGRRRKLRARAERYRSLLELIETQSRGDGRDRLRRLEEEELLELERDLAGLKERILCSVVNIIEARSRLREIRTRWGKLADEIMTERENRGLPRGRVDALGCAFTPPPPGSSPEHKAAHDLLRELGL